MKCCSWPRQPIDRMRSTDGSRARRISMWLSGHAYPDFERRGIAIAGMIGSIGPEPMKERFAGVSQYHQTYRFVDTTFGAARMMSCGPGVLTFSPNGPSTVTPHSHEP